MKTHTAKKVTQGAEAMDVASKPQFIAHHRESDSATQSLATHLCNMAMLANVFAGKIGLDKQGEKQSKKFEQSIKETLIYSNVSA